MDVPPMRRRVPLTGLCRLSCKLQPPCGASSTPFRSRLEPLLVIRSLERAYLAALHSSFTRPRLAAYMHSSVEIPDPSCHRIHRVSGSSSRCRVIFTSTVDSIPTYLGRLASAQEELFVGGWGYQTHGAGCEPIHATDTARIRMVICKPLPLSLVCLPVKSNCTRHV